MYTQHEADVIDRGIRLSWSTWGGMRGHQLAQGDISYVKTTGDKGFERIFSVRLEGANTAERVEQMIAHIKAGLLPDALLLTPNARPSNLAETLDKKGFLIDDADPCMMMYLDQASGPAQLPDGFSVTPVRDRRQLGRWLDIVNASLFGGELVTLEQMHDVFRLDHARFYLGYYLDTPVTCCLTLREKDTAVLDLVATQSEHRRRGYATAMVQNALSELREAGVETVSLRAEADGVGVYRRIGFKTCFNRIVARCDWANVYGATCPCRVGEETIQKAMALRDDSTDVADFVDRMQARAVIGRAIRYAPGERAIYVTKRYAADDGGCCPDNPTLIGRRCHCGYVNHLRGPLPMSYCKCGAVFYQPLFCALFGDAITITPVQTVLAGDEECVFRITLPMDKTGA